MKSFLLYKDRELPAAEGYLDKDTIIQDLNLKVIFQAASRPVWKQGDSLKQAEQEDFFIYNTVKRIMLIPLENSEQVQYRHRILKELVAKPDFARKLYQIGQSAGKALSKNRDRGKEGRGRAAAGSGELLSRFDLLKKLLAEFDQLKELLNGEELSEKSGLAVLKERINEEYSPDFREGIFKILADMEFFTEGGNVVFSMGLGVGLKEDKICLRKVVSRSSKIFFSKKEEEKGRTGLFSSKQKTKDTAEITGQQKEKTGKTTGEKWYQKLFATNVTQLKDDAQRQEARQLEEAAFAYMLSYFEPFLNHLCEFFEAFHIQTAFYLGCVQLWERAASFGARFCFPEVVESRTDCYGFDFSGLYELSLAILTRSVPVTNSLAEKDCRLLIITGANQGGKSTCLRSFGLAQVMLQCGMFVPASSYRGYLYQNIYTHFTRREDTTMSSGRLDEELKRMDGIVRTVTKDSLLLLNESFATTTEKEGSVIAMELISALYEAGIRVAMVTHLLQFARELYAKKPEHAVFLSAERKENGARTYRMVHLAPENTSFGLDLYDEIIIHNKTTEK